MKERSRGGVRPARRADVASIAGWSAAGWTAAQFEAEVDKPDALFLAAEEDGALRGHVLARVVLDEAQLVDVAVDERHRGRGIGRLLLESLFAGAAGRKCRVVTLEVSSRNPRALELYQTAGFRVVGRRSKFYNDGADAVLMDRPLP